MLALLNQWYQPHSQVSVEGGDAAQDSNKHQLKGAGSMSVFSEFQSKTRVVLNLTDV